RVYGDLGMVLWQLKAPRAEEYCRKGHDLMKSLPAERPLVQMQLGVGLNNLAIFLKDRRQWAEARLLLEQAIVHQQTALKADPKSRNCRKHLRNHYVNLAVVLEELGEPAQSEEIFRQEFELLEELVADFPDNIEFQER